MIHLLNIRGREPTFLTTNNNVSDQLGVSRDTPQKLNDTEYKKRRVVTKKKETLHKNSSILMCEAHDICTNILKLGLCSTYLLAFMLHTKNNRIPSQYQYSKCNMLSKVDHG